MLAAAGFSPSAALAAEQVEQDVQAVQVTPQATTAAQPLQLEAQTRSAQNGWVIENGERYWYDYGVRAESKEVYDPGSDAWYWFDADGTMAHDKDVYLPAGNKWVRYDSAGHMVKGEDCRYGGWYYFDEVTGEMAKGVKLIEAPEGWKWVYYDATTGQMAHGEAYLSYDEYHTGWYLFDEVSGAIRYGWQCPAGAKWVYYNAVTGQMTYSEQFVPAQGSFPSGWYCFDEVTGERVIGWKWFGASGGKLVYYDPQSQGVMSHGVMKDCYGITYQFDEVTGGLLSGVVTINVGVSMNTFASLQGVASSCVTLEGWNDGNQNMNLLKFADLRRSANTVTAQQLDAFIDSTERGRTGSLHGHGQDVLDAANAYGIDAVYLLSHAIVESGWGTSALASGEHWNQHTFNGVEYPAGNYYNFFGWGAFDSNAYNGGMNYAQVNGWSSARAALLGGAKVISGGYMHSGRVIGSLGVDCSQKTLYEMRFDPLYTAASGVRSTHEYATDPQWAATIASVMASFYRQSDASADYSFAIPVFS